MSEYKVIYRADCDSRSPRKVMWERPCPIMFEAIQVSRDVESGKAFLQVKVKNISSDVVRSFSASLCCMYADKSSECIDLEPLDADMTSGESFIAHPIALKAGNVTEVRGRIVRASSTMREWVSRAEPEPLPARIRLNLSDEELTRRAEYLKELGCARSVESAGYSTVREDGWIQCSCGQLNVGRKTCISCGLKFDSELSEDEVHKKIIARRRSIGFAAAAVIAVVLAAGISWSVFVGQPQAEAREAYTEIARNSGNLFTIDEWSTRGEWDSIRSRQENELRALINSSYDRMSAETQEDCLRLLAHYMICEAIYRDGAHFSDTSTKWESFEMTNEGDGVYRVKAVLVTNETSSSGNIIGWRDRYSAEANVNTDTGTAEVMSCNRTDTELLF